MQRSPELQLAASAVLSVLLFGCGGPKTQLRPSATTPESTQEDWFAWPRPTRRGAPGLIYRVDGTEPVPALHAPVVRPSAIDTTEIFEPHISHKGRTLKGKEIDVSDLLGIGAYHVSKGGKEVDYEIRHTDVYQYWVADDSLGNLHKRAIEALRDSGLTRSGRYFVVRGAKACKEMRYVFKEADWDTTGLRMRILTLMPGTELRFNTASGGTTGVEIDATFPQPLYYEYCPEFILEQSSSWKQFDWWFLTSAPVSLLAWYEAVNLNKEFSDRRRELAVLPVTDMELATWHAQRNDARELARRRDDWKTLLAASGAIAIARIIQDEKWKVRNLAKWPLTKSAREPGRNVNLLIGPGLPRVSYEF